MMPPRLRSAFTQFSRNGRWGTCVDCPRDVEGKVYPEFCTHTERYDHLLDFEDLAFKYEREAKSTVNENKGA